MVRLENLKKNFQTDSGQLAAIDGVSLDVRPSQLLTLLGPSGCGKTTTLRCIAGLEHPDAGVIQIGGETVFSSAEKIAVPANRRRIGMVFQSYAIWPHMSVFENVAFPLEGTNLNKREVRRRVEQALDLVGLLPLASRPAPHLSGGQQQRVALARALVAEPEVLLLDEPLSNLDAKLRISMRAEIRALQQRLGITTIYVTHDQQEALSISDQVVVMSHGRIVEIGTPSELYQRPKARFTAEFIGSANVMPITAALAPGSGGRLCARCAFGDVELASYDAQPRDGGRLVLMIRPEHVVISLERAADAVNCWPAQVKSVTFLGNFTECFLDLNGQVLLAQISGLMSLAVGQNVFLRFPAEQCTLVRDDGLGSPRDAAKEHTSSAAA
jgi:iron(III) transport system ATP-binding protein